jgi:hypothetical protein
MNIPNRASRHHAMRASFCAALSRTGCWEARDAKPVEERRSANARERERTEKS